VDAVEIEDAVTKREQKALLRQLDVLDRALDDFDDMPPREPEGTPAWDDLVDRTLQLGDALDALRRRVAKYL
jgi:hypothetical protein